MTSVPPDAQRSPETQLSEASNSYRPEAASTCESNLMPLSQTRGEGERPADIRFFDIREVGEQLLDRAPGGHRPNDPSDGHTHAADAWFAAHDLGIHSDAVELVHVVIIARADPAPGLPGTLSHRIIATKRV